MAVTISRWYLDSEVERYLLQKGYKIISMREILSNYFNAPKTIKEISNSYEVPTSYLYKKFAYKTDIDLQKLVKCVSDSITWLKSEDGYKGRYRFSWSLCYSFVDGRFTMFERRGEEKLITSSSFLISNVFKSEVYEVLRQNGLSSY